LVSRAFVRDCPPLHGLPVFGVARWGARLFAGGLMFLSPRRLLSSLALVALLGGGALPLPAQSGNDPVVVRRVQFNQAGRGTDTWLQMALTLQGGPNASPSARNADFNDLVKVRVMVSFQSPGGGEAAFSFYRSEATLVSLERGREVLVAFFLPPEIVRRDRLGREPFAWLIELEVGGELLPGRREHVSRSLNSLDIISSFRTRIAAEAPRTDGQMVPVYLTPFHGADAPSYVRREPAP